MAPDARRRWPERYPSDPELALIRALRHPALQGLAGVGAFIALTWPLLVFDRPVHVVISFFVIWAGVIALLFVFSRAPEGPEPEFGDGGDSPSSDDAAGNAHEGGADARGH